MAILLKLISKSATTPTKEITFSQDKIIIGRGKNCDLMLPFPYISYHHLFIIREGINYFLIDNNSTNGTYLNNQRVPPERKKLLRSGDKIQIGDLELTFIEGVPMQVESTLRQRAVTIARQLLLDSLSNSNIQKEETTPSLIVLNGPQAGTSFYLPQPPAKLKIGRSENCDIVLFDIDVSREHALLEIEWDHISIKDLSSKNGVFVNNQKVNDCIVHDRDEIKLGSTILVVSDPLEAKLKEIINLSEKQTESLTQGGFKSQSIEERGVEAQSYKEEEEGETKNNPSQDNISVKDKGEASEKINSPSNLKEKVENGYKNRVDEAPKVNKEPITDWFFVFFGIIVLILSIILLLTIIFKV